MSYLSSSRPRRCTSRVFVILLYLTSIWKSSLAGQCYSCLDPLITAVDGSTGCEAEQSATSHGRIKTDPNDTRCAIAIYWNPQLDTYYWHRELPLDFKLEFFPPASAAILSNKYICNYASETAGTLRVVMAVCFCNGSLCNYHSALRFLPLLDNPYPQLSPDSAGLPTVWRVYNPREKYKCYRCSDPTVFGNCAETNGDTLNCCDGCSITLQPGGTGIIMRGCAEKTPPRIVPPGQATCEYFTYPSNPSGRPGIRCLCIGQNYCNGIKWPHPDINVNITGPTPPPFENDLYVPPPVTQKPPRTKAPTTQPTTTSTTTTTTTTSTITFPPDGC